MNNIIVRDILEEDLPALKSLMVEAFGDGWNLGRYDKSADYFDALLEVYLSVFLNYSTFGRVVEVDGYIAGAVLVSAGGEVEKFRLMQKNIALNTLALLSAPEAERIDMVEHLSKSFQTIGQLLEHRIGDYDGSLEFIAVSKQAQGKKIGKRLWDEAYTYYKSKGVRSIYLIADSACNVGFYEHNGFTRVDAKETEYSYTTGQKKFDVYVYEYSF